jgi:hypothetical protein
MTISAEMFNDILASLNGDGRNGRTSERRKGARVGVRAIVCVERLVVGDTGYLAANVHVREISRGGIGFVSPTRMSRGETLRVVFPSSQGGNVSAEYVVRHVQLLGPCLFRVGCELMSIEQKLVAESTGMLRRAG